MTIRETARALRLRREADDVNVDEHLAACLPLEEAMETFTGPHVSNDNEVFPYCCGKKTKIVGGFFGGEAECEACGALILDVLAPLSSPLLKRGNSYITTPNEEFVARMKDRHWLVWNEGDDAKRTAAKETSK